jgi:hypothetical protein
MPKNQPTDIQVAQCLDLDNLLAGFDLVSISIGPAGELYLLAVEAPADYRGVNAAGVGFAKIVVDRTQDYVILCHHDGETAQVRISGQRWNYHHIQPLPDGEILLVNARSRRRGKDDYDLNAKVLTDDGTQRREFLLGDGIQDVQTTADGRIWTSYFDEGVFGNYGWDDPVGWSGLALWNKSGELLYEYTPSEGLDWMCDCYALNVVSNEEAWCYYYTQFPLVRICNQQIQAFWDCPVQGAGGFALWQDMVLFRGDYDNRDLYYLFGLVDDGSMEACSVYRMVDKEGDALQPEMFASRGRFMFFTRGSRCYQVDLEDLVS